MKWYAAFKWALSYITIDIQTPKQSILLLISNNVWPGNQGSISSGIDFKNVCVCNRIPHRGKVNGYQPVIIHKQLVEIGSPPPCGSWDQTGFIGLADKCLNQLTHLTANLIIYWKKPLIVNYWKFNNKELLTHMKLNRVYLNSYSWSIFPRVVHSTIEQIQEFFLY